MGGGLINLRRETGIQGIWNYREVGAVVNSRSQQRHS